VRKTIVFVTHDIDEAIKLGDRIALLREGGHLAQYDTPDRLLAHPADDFVARFVGADRGLKRLALRRLSEIELEPVTAQGLTVPASTTLRDALSLMMSEGADPLVVTADDGTPIGQISVARVGRLLTEL
jgi:osmoprotectant transport system ATP-binding protein